MEYARTMDMTSKVIHNVFTILAVISTIVLLSYSLSASSTDNGVFLTNTFLSTYYSDTPAVTYTPAGDPYTDSQVKDTFYSCLYEAQVGMNDELKCTDESVEKYTTCINEGTTNSEKRALRIANAIIHVLSTYKGDTWNLTALPSDITSMNLEIMKNTTSNSVTLNAVLVKLEKMQTTIADDVYKAINEAQSMSNGIVGCLATVNTAPPIMHDIVPVYDELWKCTSAIVKVDVANRRAFDLCIPQSAWPPLDVMQTPYSTTFLGSYNKYFFLTIGMWLMCSFAVFSLWINMDGKPTANGKPQEWFARAGKFFTLFSALWNAGAIVLVIVRSFDDPSKANSFPMSIQTVFITLFFTVFATIYFVKELWEIFFYGSMGQAPSGSTAQAELGFTGSVPSGSEGTGERDMRTRFRYRTNRTRVAPRIGAYMRVSNQDIEIETADYTPILVPAWSDCWILVDGLIFLGIIGTSRDVVTVDIVISFLAILASCVAGSSLVRLLDQGCINNVSDNDKAKLGVRVMAINANIAALMFSLMYWYLVFSRYTGSALIISFVVVSSVVPCLYWLIISLLLEFNGLQSLVQPAQIAFSYNILIRSVFVLVLVASFKADSDATYNNDDSLSLMIRYINA